MSVCHQRLVSAGHAQLHVEGITRMIKTAACKLGSKRRRDEKGLHGHQGGHPWLTHLLTA